MKTKKVSGASHTRRLQQLFVFSVVACFVVTLSQQISIAMSQIATNPNLSAFYTTFLVLGLMPAGLFMVSYLLVSRKISVWQRIFESSMVAVAGYAATMAFGTLVMSIYWGMKIPFGDMFGSFGLHTLSVFVITAGIVLYLLMLRRTGRW